MKKSILLAALLATASLPAEAQNRDAAAPLAFEGHFVVSISDADMLASAYVDGQLGPREGADVLSVFRMTGDPRDWSAVEVPVSNSVAGPPAALDLSPDGRWAFVIETFGPRPDGDGPHGFGDLGVGTVLTVVDLADTAAPVVAQTLSLPQRPKAVRMNPAGTWLAVTFHGEGAGAETPLALIPFAGGRPRRAGVPDDRRPRSGRQSDRRGLASDRADSGPDHRDGQHAALCAHR